MLYHNDILVLTTYFVHTIISFKQLVLS